MPNLAPRKVFSVTALSKNTNANNSGLRPSTFSQLAEDAAFSEHSKSLSSRGRRKVGVRARFFGVAGERTIKGQKRMALSEEGFGMAQRCAASPNAVPVELRRPWSQR